MVYPYRLPPVAESLGTRRFYGTRVSQDREFAINLIGTGADKPDQGFDPLVRQLRCQGAAISPVSSHPNHGTIKSTYSTSPHAYSC